MATCFFCKLYQLRQGTVWEGQAFFAVFDNYPVSPGHVLVVPKQHIVDFSEIKKEVWSELREAIRKSINIIERTDLEPIYKKFIEDHETDKSVWFCKKALKNLTSRRMPTAYNHGFNDGKVSGRTVDHFHWHIIPRFDGDMKGSRGGVRFVIPKMGDYH